MSCIPIPSLLAARPLFLALLAALGPLCSAWPHAGVGAPRADADRERLLALDGVWTGALGYRDYGTEAWTELPLRVAASAERDGAFLALRSAFDEGGWTLRETAVRAVDGATGELVELSLGPRGAVASRRAVTGREVRGVDDWTLVLERPGTDDGRPATIRETLSRAGDAYSERKEVRFADAAAWVLRSEVRLERVDAAAPALLVGRWRVDLRPAPDAPPHLVDLVVAEAGADGVAGTFYGSDLAEGRVNAAFGAVHLAFTTSDGTGAYHTSAALDGDVLRGTTHSLGRDFLAVWTATRAAD